MPAKKRRENYTSEDVDNAVNATKEDGLSIRQASEQFGVPKLTILDRLRGSHGDTMGRPIVLSEDEETQLLERIQVGNSIQYGTYSKRYRYRR
jgi:transposase